MAVQVKAVVFCTECSESALQQTRLLILPRVTQEQPGDEESASSLPPSMHSTVSPALRQDSTADTHKPITLSYLILTPSEPQSMSNQPFRDRPLKWKTRVKDFCVVEIYLNRLLFLSSQRGPDTLVSKHIVKSE